MPEFPFGALYFILCSCISAERTESSRTGVASLQVSRDDLQVQHWGVPVHLFEGMPWDSLRHMPSWQQEGTFELKDLHRFYLSRNATQNSDEAWRVWYLKGNTHDMCGTGLFTQSEENCNAVNAREIHAFVDELIGGMNDFTIPRKFGIEFEFVIRSEDEEQTRACFAEKVKAAFDDTGLWDTPCTSSADCKFEGWPVHGWAVCENKRCRPFSDVTCPQEGCAEMYQWATDGAIVPLTEEQLAEKNVDAERMQSELRKGYNLELVSPLNPLLEGHSGLRSALWTLLLLRDQGVQAPPSVDLHMHVNAIGLTPVKLHNIWANYARFQYVIAEMTQDSQVFNGWQRPMILERPPLRRFYSEMHRKATVEGADTDVFQDNNKTDRDKKQKYCNEVVKAWSTMSTLDSCSGKHAQARTLQVNIVPLHKYGSIEFRAFSGTHDPKRFVEWIVFVHRFLNKYTDFDALGLLQLNTDQAVAKLRAEQETTASLDQLEAELGVNMDYWRNRPWLDNDPACQWKPFA